MLKLRPMVVNSATGTFSIYSLLEQRDGSTDTVKHHMKKSGRPGHFLLCPSPWHDGLYRISDTTKDWIDL